MPVAATRVVLLGLLGLIVATPPALADYPERPITIIVPFAPGGANDIVARILSEPLAKALGQPIVIDNRPGASGNIGMGAAARAPADGYWILIAATGLAANPSLYAKVPFDPLKDFVAIADIASFPSLITVRPGLGVNSLSELIAYAKANPGKLNYASSGVGTVPHLAAELLKLSAGIDMVHIPFHGATPALQAVLAGSVEVGLMSMSVTLPQVKAGNLKALAVTGRERWPELPDVATLGEAGFPEAIAEAWQGFLAPSGTPEAVIGRFSAEVVAILQRPDIREKFHAAGFAVVGEGGQALRALITSEVVKWRDVITRAGIKGE